ncbi:hypothetical protein WICMUC_000491 [Wickerhamomyces mucosus]|uniref:TauD/TfdA-like domain-containing protein n=1 Tax=Wickerhamomyces mucosus TaxID=1378264 RepID=A0A9P8TJ35_9ASCO|nr:hypothetical protein WICMUC_000491 [Wickerhamomyces mucosus]
MPTSTSVETDPVQVNFAKLNLKSKLSEDQIVDIKKKLKSLDQFPHNIYGLRVEIGEDGIIRTPKDESETAKYKDWLPTWDPLEKYEPYEVFPFEDKGLKADKDFKNLFNSSEYKVADITPKFGTEISGIQLSQLTDEGKNDLARYVAERGVVVFKDQDLKDKGPGFAEEFGEYFGPLHIHPTTGAPEGHSKIHLVYKPSDSIKPQDAHLKTHSKANFWHSDVSYEKQPPSITFLGILEGPVSGGDTAFLDATEAYNRLSPEFQQIIERLQVVHQGVKQAQNSRDTIGIVRREPVTNIHPLVRTHPVTGKKSIYVNPGFSTEIVGLKYEESQAILSFLYDHLHTSIDLHARVKWSPGSVVVWDNRRTSHTALFDWETDERRHLFRITPRAEVPYLDK